MQENEIKELIEVLPYLGSVFPEAVKLILKLQAVKATPGNFYKSMDEKNLADKYPDEVTDILIKVLKEERHIYIQDPLKNIISIVFKKNIAKEKLKELKVEAYRLGIKI